jgi:serine protease Do
MAMSVERCSGRVSFIALSAIALSACSPTASTAVPPVPAAQAPAAQLPPAQPLVTGLPDFTALVERYGPAVVNVQVTERASSRASPRAPGGQQNDPFEFFRRFGIPTPNAPDAPQGNEPRARGEGSGFIVTADGYIMTNAHVVNGATEVVVKLTDRREFPAKIVGLDESTDVAVIKIEGKDLPTVRLGDPSQLKPGQWVVAIGSPFGMENSVTAGIVSATGRDIDRRADRRVPFIQTDVAVNPGNSGGPLFNLSGEVVGINSQIYSQSGGYMGLSFAIPIDIANDVRQQLVSTGKVSRGRIGVGIRPMDGKLAEAFGLDRPRGALIERIEPASPAEKAGLKEGDIILSVNGKQVDEVQLPAAISAIRPGGSAELEVWTDRKARKVAVRVGEFPDANLVATRASGSAGSAAAEPAALGLTVRPLTSEEQQQVETTGSLVVEAVDGAAEEAGMRPGDIILGVNGSRVKTLAELRAATKRSGNTAALLVQREGGQTFIAIPTK